MKIKRILHTLVLAMLLLPEAGAQTAGIVYSLPRTTLNIRVKASRETFTAGPYAAYAQKYLGVAAQTQSGTTWTLQEIVLTPFVEADPEARFTVGIPEKSMPNFLQLCTQGLVVMDGGPIGQPAAWRFAGDAAAERFEGVDPLGNLGSERTVLYKAVRTDEGYERVPVTQDNVVEKSPDRKAADAAALIFSLREKRQQIATGDTDATFSGEALQAAIDEIDRLESRCLSLFYGIREVSSEEKSFDVTPTSDEKSQRLTAFRLSDKDGLQPASASEGKAVTLEIKVEPLAEVEPVSERTKEAVVRYRIPAVTRCRLLQDGRLLLESRILIHQLGEESTMPLNALITR